MQGVRQGGAGIEAHGEGRTVGGQSEGAPLTPPFCAAASAGDLLHAWSTATPPGTRYTLALSRGATAGQVGSERTGAPSCPGAP